MDNLKNEFPLRDSVLRKIDENEFETVEQSVLQATAKLLEEHIGHVDETGHKIRQIDFAHLLGISNTSLKNYLQRRTSLPLSMLGRLSLVTGQRFQTIVGKLLSHLPQNLQEDIEKLDLSGLKKNQRDSIRQLLQGESELLGNHFNWSMEILTMLSKCSEEEKARVELIVLQAIKKANSKSFDKQRQDRAIDLFKKLL